MKYAYAGPGPHDDGEGGLVRPGDVREFEEEPGWGPWTPVDEMEDGTAPPPPAPAVPAPVPVKPAASSEPGEM